MLAGCMIYSRGFVYSPGAKKNGTAETILTTEVNFALGMSMGLKRGLYLVDENAYLCSE